MTTNPTAEWIAGQVTEAFPWSEAPRHLIRDRDRAFGAAYTRRVHAMGIRDRPTAARSPWQNGHVERLIGSVRRECLDHVLVFGEADLRRVLKTYAGYYNKVRTPYGQNIGHVIWPPVGLSQPSSIWPMLDQNRNKLTSARPPNAIITAGFPNACQNPFQMPDGCAHSLTPTPNRMKFTQASQ